MDDRPAGAFAAETYRCPGEAYSISHAVHTGRLASFYSACRDCPHRHDTRALVPLQVRHWSEIERRRERAPRFSAEALEAAAPQDLDRSVVRRFAMAVAKAVWEQYADAQPPQVIVGADGHWTTAELVASACTALEWSGCRAIEIGSVTSAALAAAAARAEADAAILIGNSTGRPNSLSLKAWGRGAQPWSSPGTLDAVQERYALPLDRPKRRSGGLRRQAVTEAYLTPLEPMYHGLRPLRFVLDTTSEVLVRYVRRLTARSACEIIDPDTTLGERHEVENEGTLIEDRLQRISRQVIAEAAHFGVWIDGDAESCHFVDDRGAVVAWAPIYRLMASHIGSYHGGSQTSNPTMVIAGGDSTRTEQALAERGATVVRCDATREATHAALRDSDAIFGGGPSGRFWYANRPTAPDALMTLSVLLAILSQSDRPLSEVLEGA